MGFVGVTLVWHTLVMTYTTEFENFLKGYIDAILWTGWVVDGDDCDADDLRHCENIVTSESLASAQRDCVDFWDGCAELLAGLDPYQCGIDFLLTRNRHGAGFWDRGLGSLGDELTEMAHPYGEAQAYYLADDHKVVFQD